MQNGADKDKPKPKHCQKHCQNMDDDSCIFLSLISGKSPATLVIPCIFPVVKVVGSNPVPPFSRLHCPHRNPVHPAVCSFQTLTSTLKNSIFNLRTFYSLVVITIDYSLSSSSLSEPRLSTLCLLVVV